MNPSSSSSSPGIPNGETPQTDGAVSVKRDAGSGGTISVNGTHPATPKSSLPSFAAILSTSSTSGRTNSSAESPSSTLLQQKPPLLCPSSGPSSHDDENNIINSTSFTIGNGITINASTQSTTSRSSPMALLPSRIHDSEGDTSLHNSNIENSNDQEDSESSDVEIYLDSFDSNTSTERMHVLSGPSTLHFFFFLVHSSRIYASFFLRDSAQSQVASFLPPVFYVARPLLGPSYLFIYSCLPRFHPSSFLALTNEAGAVCPLYTNTSS